MIIIALIVLLFISYYILLKGVSTPEEVLIIIALLLIVCFKVKKFIDKHKVNKIIGKLDDEILTDFIKNDGKNVETLHRKKEIAQKILNPKKNTFFSRVGEICTKKLAKDFSVFLVGDDHTDDLDINL